MSIDGGLAKTNIKQIEFLARAIVNRLEDRGLVRFGGGGN